jgi:pimeloyl-ACP methyl ester carboxylesterase
MVVVGSLETSILQHGSGDPVILIHGITNTLDVWRPLMGALKSHEFIAYNQRLHGGAKGLDDNYSLNSYGDDIYNVINKYCDISRVTIIAHSFGCVSVQNFLQKHDDRVKRVIMLHSTAESPNFLQLDLENLKQKIDDAMTNQAFANLLDPYMLKMPEIAIETPIEMMRNAQSMRLFSKADFDMLKKSLNFNYISHNESILQKNLIVIGASFDEIVGRDELLTLQRSLPTSKLEWVNTGHMSMFSPSVIHHLGSLLDK